MGDLLSLTDTARRLRGALSDTLMIAWGPAWRRSSFRACSPISKEIFPVCGLKS